MRAKGFDHLLHPRPRRTPDAVRARAATATPMILFMFSILNRPLSKAFDEGYRTGSSTGLSAALEAFAVELEAAARQQESVGPR